MTTPPIEIRDEAADDRKFKKVIQHFLKMAPQAKKATRKKGETKASPKPQRKKERDA